MKYFIDRNLSIYLAKALAALCKPDSIEVVHLDQKFEQTTPDHEWIKALAAEGDWAIVTQDRLRKNQVEREALKSTGIITFFLTKQWAHQKEWDKAAALIRWWPQIMSVASNVSSGGFLVPFKFSGKGKFDPISL